MNNTSCYNSKPLHDVPRSVDVYLNVAAAVILILSVAANTLVLRGIYLTHCKPISYILITNIALAELIGSLVAPFRLYSFTSPWHWMLGMVMCRLIFSANICCSIVVSSSLATFSIYSCFILRKPNTAKLRRAVHVSVFISWLWGLALSLPFSVVAKIEAYPLCKGGEYVLCRFQGYNKSIQIYVGIATFVSRLLVPFAVTILSYGVLLVKIKNLIGKSQGYIVSQESTGRVPAIENHEDQNIQQDPTKDRHAEGQQEQQEEQKEDGTTNEPLPIINELENKLRRIIYWMVIIYLACYAPEHFAFLSWRFDWFVVGNKMVFRKHTVVLMLVPKLLHPICFGWAAGIIQRNFNAASQ